MTSPFNTQNSPNGATAPASDCYPISPNDGADLPVPIRAFYATGEGDVSVVTASGSTRTIPVAAFMIVPLAVVRVRASGTTATGIMGFSL
jgi:hypothetical protein